MTNSNWVIIQIMTNSQATAEVKNCKIENLYCLFRPLAQYLGSDKRQVLSAGVTWDSVPPKAVRGTNKLIPPGPKIPVERIRGTKQINPPSCKQIRGGSKCTSIKYYYNIYISIVYLGGCQPSFGREQLSSSGILFQGG